MRPRKCHIQTKSTTPTYFFTLQNTQKSLDQETKLDILSIRLYSRNETVFLNAKIHYPSEVLDPHIHIFSPY